MDKENFSEYGIVISYSTYAEDNEGALVVRLDKKSCGKKAKLPCFVCFSRSVRELKELVEKRVRKVKLNFSLLPYKINKINQRIKRFQIIRPTPIGNKYCVRGEVVSLEKYIDKAFQKDFIKITIDCGFFVSTSFPKKEQLKVGDFLEIEGRLDAKLTEDDDNES